MKTKKWDNWKKVKRKNKKKKYDFFKKIFYLLFFFFLFMIQCIYNSIVKTIYLNQKRALYSRILQDF